MTSFSFLPARLCSYVRYRTFTGSGKSNIASVLIKKVFDGSPPFGFRRRFLIAIPDCNWFPQTTLEVAFEKCVPRSTTRSKMLPMYGLEGTRKGLYRMGDNTHDMGLHGQVEKLTAVGETVAVVTVTEIEGSAPQEPGAEMLVRADGETIGTVGGGTVEELSRQAAVEAIEEREPRTPTWELEPGGNTGMVCGGEMTVFINIIEGERRLIVAGGGHIAKPLVRLAIDMGYDVCVVDDREEYAKPERFPDAEIFHGDYEEGIASFEVTDNTAVTIATRSGTTDQSAACEALSQGAYYVGIVASENKASHVREGLRDDGLDEDLIDQLHSPVGLDLGGSNPEDVALSILSELNRVRHGRAPGQIIADEQAMDDIG